MFLRAKDFLNQKKPFVLFALPASEKIQGFFQKDNISYYCSDFSESGFVFAPFKHSEKLVFIPKKQSEVFETSLPDLSSNKQEFYLEETPEEKEKYEALVKQTIDYINKDNAQKIVTSRCKKIGLKNFNLSMLCERLFALPDSTCRYVWFHPETGLWCGATPEILIETSGDAFTTMALAGTKKIEKDKEPQWSAKEILEQRFVKDAILDVLADKTKVLKSSKTYNHRAGNVVHLRTDISGVFNAKNTLFDIVTTLHPTPAVCGTPKNQALAFILEKEGYDRKYYTGFLGLINKENAAVSLFVNLRCLQIYNNVANLFVGGGITFDSNPEKEWEETQNKLQTMIPVISPFF
jgi:isochorismate synthase